MQSKLSEQESSQAQWNIMAEDLGVEPIMSSSSEEYMSSFAYAKRNDATDLKESQKDSHQSDLDAPVPGLEDSSMDTDASEDEALNELAGNERIVGTSPRRQTDSPVSEFAGFMEGSHDEELSAPPESSGDSIVTDLVANTSLVGSSRRSKSGAGMFSKLPARGPDKTVKVHETSASDPDTPMRVNKSKVELNIIKPRRFPKEFASNSKAVPVKPRPYRRPKDSTSNEDDVQVRPRKLSKDSTKRTKNSNRRGQAKAEAKCVSMATGMAAKTKKRNVPRKKKREVVDDDSSDYSGSVSTGTMGSTDEDLVTAFMDFIDLDLDSFEEDNLFEDEHSVGSATASIDSEVSAATNLDLARKVLPGAAKTEKTSYICNDPGAFEGLYGCIGMGEVKESAKSTEEMVEDVQPVSSKHKKSQRSKKVEEVDDKVAQDVPGNLDAVVDSAESSPDLRLADFFDISFFTDLWNELFPPKKNTGIAPETTKSADQKSPSLNQTPVNSSFVSDTEAETLFDDLLEDDTNDDDSFAGLASILKSTSTAVDDFRAQLDGSKDATVAVEPVNESQEDVKPKTSHALNESAEVTPKVPVRGAQEEWLQFSDSPFVADDVSRTISTPTKRLRRSVSIPMEEPILLKRLHSLDAKCSLLTSEELELTAPATPDDRDETELNLIYSASFDDPSPDRRNQKSSFSPPKEVELYPPNDEAFESFETVPTTEKDELFLCGPASKDFSSWRTYH